MGNALPMKARWLVFAWLAACGALLAGCSTQSPGAGHEVVLIEKPWFFGHGGVNPEPVRTGLTFSAITTSGIDVNMQPQKFEALMSDTMTADGVPISFHAVIVLQVADPSDALRRLTEAMAPVWEWGRERGWAVWDPNTHGAFKIQSLAEFCRWAHVEVLPEDLDQASGV